MTVGYMPTLARQRQAIQRAQQAEAYLHWLMGQCGRVRNDHIQELLRVLQPVSGAFGVTHLRGYQLGEKMRRQGHLPEDPYEVPEPAHLDRECPNCSGRGWLFSFAAVFYGPTTDTLDLDAFQGRVRVLACRSCCQQGRRPWE